MNCIIAGYFGSPTNISLVDTAFLYVEAYDAYQCQEIYVKWEIVRADGEIEVYNATPQRDYYYYSSYSKDYPENGLSLNTRCDIYCEMRLWLSPTDMRYNGAQFTCTLNLPECGTTNITDPITVNIQGKVQI